jgi:hypothetical protein
MRLPRGFARSPNEPGDRPTTIVAMWGLAALVVAVTATGGDDNLTGSVYRVVAGMLLALAVLTALTGARTRVIWFKICPLLLTGTATLLVVASVL